MDLNSSAQEQINLGSPLLKDSTRRGLRRSPRSPPTSPPTSPHKRRLRHVRDDSLENGSPDSSISGLLNFAYLDENSLEFPDGMVLFAVSPVRSPQTRGSPSKMSPQTRRSPKRFPSKKASKLRQGIDLFGNKATPPKEEFPFSPATYTVDFRKWVSDENVRSPLPEFFLSLKKNGSISETTDLPPRGKEVCDCSGSFFEASFIRDEVVKTASLGPEGTIDKKDLVKVMDATALCSGNSNCAEVLSFHIDHRETEKEATVTIVQKQYRALQRNDILPFLMCIISLLRTYIPQGFCPTDLKIGNFGMGDDGFVRWFDFDFKPVAWMKAFIFIKSGEFQHSGNPEFQRFILMLMEFYCPIGLDRKQAFGELNNRKGLLQSLNLLDNDKPISMTTIHDFAIILSRIGLSEEDIAYLVGLLTPPSSQ